MKEYGLNELREMFLSFYEERGHLRLPSFPLVPQGDASLLLINSGMAPMKPWFTGEQEPPRKRVTTCQKCIRTGDIENVGKTSRHGTYFEMLGNFSFGDYFKEEAISWYWEFLTKTVGIDESLLYPSVYVEDDEAFAIWRDKIGVAPERIARLGKSDNFWDVGAGPCGPCSEVYFDRGAEHGCDNPGCAPGCDCDRFIEIGNNVFTQFSNDGGGNYTELAQKNIDFGGGLERLAVVCQGVGSLFEVDTVMSIINKVSEISGVNYRADEKSDVSIRVIADHIRSATMMICDGVLPSNEGRGYVLRRLLRRAARHGRLLGISGVFLCDMCATVIGENKTAYPDLVDKSGFIARVIRIEEENFGKTIDAGMGILSGLTAEYEKRGEKVFSGADAFKLYDTYGFPLDMTTEILAEHGLTADEESFNGHMEAQRNRARKAREALGDLAWTGVDLGLDNTPTKFTGYDATRGTGKILAIVTQGETASNMREGDEGIIVLDRTPFYAEMGGQSADFGTIWSEGGQNIKTTEPAGSGQTGGTEFEVRGVQLVGNKYLHHGKMRKGSFGVDDTVTAEVDEVRRGAIMRAHSATHLLHTALRGVLGDHVRQAGSLVEPDRLRFDFTHFSALTKEELKDVEAGVNAAMLAGWPVTVEEMPVGDAKKLGATALFGEKYGDTVRVVNMGGISIELCGGTHLDNTAKAGAFCIQSEFSVASGVRRIEAVTGKETLTTLNSARSQLTRLAEMMKANATEELEGKIEQNMRTVRELRSALDSAMSREAQDEAQRLLAGAREVGGLKVVTAVFEDASADVDRLRQLEDTLRDREAGVVAVVASINADKITVMAACGKEAVAKGVKAGELIKEITKLCGGSGGGKPEFAMGGGKNAGKLRDALDTLDELVKQKLGM